MNAEELAERFREDRARLVEAEPLVDRAFTSVMASFDDKFAEPVIDRDAPARRSGVSADCAPSDSRTADHRN